MKHHLPLSIALPLFLVLSLVPGCSRLRDQEGQIFVVSAGRDNIKMGLVGVHVLTEEQLRAVSAPLLKSYEGATEKFRIHSAQCERDSSVLTELQSELAGLVPQSLKIPEIDRLEIEATDRISAIQSTDRGECADPLLAEGALAERFVAALPPPAQKTDADGRFNVRAGPGDWLIAKASRTLIRGSEENYLWICRIPEKKTPALLSNDSLMDTSELLAFLSTRSGLTFAPRESQAPSVSRETEAWVQNARNAALAARERAIADDLESAKSKYNRTLDSVPVELLSKWGGEGWRTLKIEVASICDNKDLLVAAASYREATAALNRIIGEVYPKEAADQQRIRTEQQRAAEADRAEKQAAQAREREAQAREREAQAREKEDKARAEKEDKVRAEKEAALEKLRNTPIFSGNVGVVSAGFRAFEFGFGFWLESTLGGAQLRIFVNGKQPSSGFSGSDADASINIDNRLKGSEQYTSGGHDFLIEWVKRNKFTWSADIVVRRLN